MPRVGRRSSRSLAHGRAAHCILRAAMEETLQWPHRRKLLFNARSDRTESWLGTCKRHQEQLWHGVFLALRRRRRACTMGLGAVDHQRDMLVGAPVLVAGNPNHGIPGHPNNRGVECDITHFMSRKWQKQGVDGQTSRHTEEEDPVTHLAPRPQSSNQVIHLTRHGWRAQPVL